MAADPSVKFIAGMPTSPFPETFLIGADGKIVYESMGFEPEEFDKMVKAIEIQLTKGK